MVEIRCFEIKIILLELVAKYFMQCYNREEQSFKTHTHTHTHIMVPDTQVFMLDMPEASHPPNSILGFSSGEIVRHYVTHHAIKSV